MQLQELGIIIQERRGNLAIKQEDLAEMAGVSPKSLYLMEQGKGNPSLDTIQKVLEILGLEILVRIKITDK